MTDQTNLKRSVGLGGAVALGLGSILGTGVFVSLGIGAGVAGEWAIGAVLLAALLATFNALSSAQLAANHPVSGGTYAYGVRYLNGSAGFAAGLAFLLAKSASAAAAAIGLVGYLTVMTGWQAVPTNVLAACATLSVTGLVALGLKRANLVNGVLFGITLAALVALIGFVFASDRGLPPVSDWQSFTPSSFLEASALLFVAFTGYGRIATLGEEVTAPRKTIPRAIMMTLIVSTLLYLGIMLAGLAVLGADGFASVTEASAAPLQAMADVLRRPGLAQFVSFAAGLAMAGVLLNLILGLSRVAFAMGRGGDLPGRLARLSAGNEPVLAVLAVGAFVSALALFGGLKLVWSFSAFTVLIYYAITNLCALQLKQAERLYPRFVPVCGFVGCLGLSVWLTPGVIMAGAGTFLAGLGLRALLR